ncbi:peptidoglycan glycosyltransferase [Crocinitomicaceae bacterium CZZ-1]|uniref:Peptidoglycan glycosyltransferase n=1 Tax=Taishania pollutisoli TaxID=2766479 RepID=A0A8J6PIZ7_9FLAO|nr:penicillin-binding transpeptidase domain-containing protein [Taishania pollutisoli]MBC9812494.1 peptidoglycan glycosyltransferase [Taishania pollutisoli]MBX2949391.1 penicillin-binding protein 2 [Crocinitomicaceae bacterium]NGF74470.1 peptidoglycan glycosyltransferase [Fluviicola sp. SGL-29]
MNFDNRKYVIIIFVALIGVVYILRLFQMQVVDDQWKVRAQEIAEKRRYITPPRAVMFDRNGKKVVSNKAYYNLMFVEKDIEDLDTIAFAKLVGMTPEEVKKRFIEIREREGYFTRKDGKKIPNYQPVRPYPFLKELTADEIAMIAPHLDKYPGFYEQVTSMRDYPYAGGANILGYLAETNREEIEKDKFYRSGDNIGKAGIEKYYEKELRGQKGVHYIVTSALNNAIESYAGGKYDTMAIQAPSLKLGMDIELQVYGELLMKNKMGCIVAIEPSSGEILAMVSAPSYDPNLFVGKSNIAKNYPILVNDPKKPLFPRPLQAEYPPGSIFKLTQALIGMQEGVIDENASFPCTQSMVGCHSHPQATSISKAIQMSCNPYFYYVTRKIIQQGKKKNIFADAEIGLGKWEEYLHSFGLGMKLDSDIAAIRPGLIPGPKFYDKWYGHHAWAFSTIRSVSIGQGEVKLTPLQMANLSAIMANRGWYITPHVVKSIGDNGPLSQFNVVHKTLIDPKYYPPVVEGMRMAVNEAGGTARRAKIEGITVCGKTGTAQNPHGEDHSVFIAFAPMDNPKIAISVFIENAGFGGTWAAPIASLMIEKYLTGEVKDKEKEKRILDAVLDNIK